MNAQRSSAADLADVLFPNGDPAAEVQRLLQQRSALEPIRAALKGVPAHLAGGATGEIGRVAAGLLHMDLVDVLASGWKKYDALAAAARATLETPGEEQVVDLVTHRISSTYRPRIDLVVDEMPAGSIDLEVDVTVVLHAVVGVVADGRLTSLRSGRTDLEAELSCEGIPITSGRREIDLTVDIDLGSGVVLAGAPA
jgi:hypothetical protein